MKKIVLIILVNIALILILGEIVSRVFPSLFDKPPPFNTAVLDNQLGWKQKGGYQYEGEQTSLNQEIYPVKLTYTDSGFRKYDKLAPDSIARVLVIGDSFTQAIEVSDGKTYYDYLEKDNDFKVFAYGMAGYGTLQEYMILDKYIDDIKPQIVVLQFCSNDFIDNELDVEKQASYQVGLWRPYLQENGEILYNSPLGFIERHLIKSNFLKFLRDKWQRLKYHLGIKKKNSSEEQIVKKGRKFEPYRQSQIITRMILEKMKLRLTPDTKLYVMNSDVYKEQADDLEQICQSVEIPLIKFPKKKMVEARKINEVYTSDGFHWNEQGHQLIGENLKQYLLKEK